MPARYPYIFFGSAPIGPIALEALRVANYYPTRVIDDPRMSTEEMLTIIEEVKPTFMLVVGYGAILRRKVLDSVAGQVLNIHPSMLPEYRGPAPVVQAILDGATETGVTLIEVDEKMDHGLIIAQEEYRLRGNELPEDLYIALTRRGVELFLHNIEGYLNETVDLMPQFHSQATFTHFINKIDGLLDLDLSPRELEQQVRAYQGWPRSWVMLDGKRLIVDKAHLESGRFRFDLVQAEGGKAMGFKEFCAGLRLKPEEVYARIGIR